MHRFSIENNISSLRPRDLGCWDNQGLQVFFFLEKLLGGGGGKIKMAVCDVHADDIVEIFGKENLDVLPYNFLSA